MRKFSFCRSDDEVVKRGDNCEDRLMLNDRVASEGKRNIGSVGNGFGNVQCGSRLNKILHQI